MKTMLLSFQPKWYEQIKEGKKIFEYRRQFSKEEVGAYLYVSKPVQFIVGYIELGERIGLYDWKEKFTDNKNVSDRVKHYLIRNRFVMPIKSFRLTKSIPLNILNKKMDKFIVPQSYYYLDNYPQLFEFIKQNALFIDEWFTNDFTNIT